MHGNTKRVPQITGGTLCCDACGRELDPRRRAYRIWFTVPLPGDPFRKIDKLYCSRRCQWRIKKRLQRGSRGPFLGARELNRQHAARLRVRRGLNAAHAGIDFPAGADMQQAEIDPAEAAAIEALARKKHGRVPVAAIAAAKRAVAARRAQHTQRSETGAGPQAEAMRRLEEMIAALRPPRSTPVETPAASPVETTPDAPSETDQQ